MAGYGTIVVASVAQFAVEHTRSQRSGKTDLRLHRCLTSVVLMEYLFTRIHLYMT